MSSEEVFTEEDMENDGIFKARLQSLMNRVAAREHEEIYQYFTSVLEGQAPPDVVLAAAAIKALNDDSFAERVLRTEPEIVSVKKSQHRTDDLEYVMDIYERFDLGQSNDELEDAIMERLSKEITGQANGPLDQVADIFDEESNKRDLEDRFDRLEQQIDRVMAGSSDVKEEPDHVEMTDEEREQDIDRLLEEDNDPQLHADDLEDEGEVEAVDGYEPEDDTGDVEVVEIGEEDGKMDKDNDTAIEEAEEETVDIEEMEELDEQLADEIEDGESETEADEEEIMDEIEEEWQDEGEGEDWDVDDSIEEENNGDEEE